MIFTKLNCKEELRSTLLYLRCQTLALFEGMDRTTFCAQPDVGFSPVGWHLGHIGYTEALWVLQHLTHQPPFFPEYHRLYAADGLPKTDRVHLPLLPEVLTYLEVIRERVLEVLDTTSFEETEPLWRFLIQHECQHSETIALVLALQGRSHANGCTSLSQEVASALTEDEEMVYVPAGAFLMGSNAPDALDNEKPQHWCYLDTYWLDRYPVTCCQYQSFIAADGYRDRQWWSAAGWQWVQAGQIQQPLYWSDALAGSDRPVCGVSYYEAEAYARFAGKRLPTEAEWEKAASWDPHHQRSRPYPWGDKLPDALRCNCDGIAGWTTSVRAYPAGASASGAWDMLGNVWEWTATCFGGYIGFQFFPYRGYSQAYFDGEHYVLKGGSWATRPQAMRNSFRNWYYPDMRQMFAGFRCARDPD